MLLWHCRTQRNAGDARITRVDRVCGRGKMRNSFLGKVESSGSEGGTREGVLICACRGCLWRIEICWAKPKTMAQTRRRGAVNEKGPGVLLAATKTPVLVVAGEQNEKGGIWEGMFVYFFVMA